MNHYKSVFDDRYGDEKIKEIFSPQSKFLTWRRLWYMLASIQAKMGVPMPVHALNELSHASYTLTDAELRQAQIYESDTHHDVVAHIMTLCDICPTAKPFIHLGATSCYITDNTDIILMREALRYIYDTLDIVINNMAQMASDYASIPTVGYTHYQPAQLTTVGKRFCMWMDGFVIDADEIVDFITSLRLLGCKGAVGTYSGMLPILGSYEKCLELDHQIAEAFGFHGSVKISGQTYNRKLDSKLMSILSGIAQSAYKFAQDIRLLAHDGEIYETRAIKQVGSSAMPYKNNPITCERICGLARYVINGSQNADHTAAVQWLERSLDDSSNRRVTTAEMFLAISEILNLTNKVLGNLSINTAVIKEHVMDHLPNTMAEQIMADGVMNGGDRQEIHEQIRTGDTNALRRMILDDALTIVKDEISDSIDPMRYIGCAVEQVNTYVRPILGDHQ